MNINKIVTIILFVLLISAAGFSQSDMNMHNMKKPDTTKTIKRMEMKKNIDMRKNNKTMKSSNKMKIEKMMRTDKKMKPMKDMKQQNEKKMKKEDSMKTMWKNKSKMDMKKDDSGMPKSMRHKDE